MFTRPDNWAQLTWQEKRERRLEQWMNPDIKFVSPLAAKNFKARAMRLAQAAKMDLPDRVPCMVPAGNFPAVHAGISFREAIYEPEKMKKAWLKFLDDFDTDTFDGVPFFHGPVADLLEQKTMMWPEHGLPGDARSYQYVEGEYMQADEYDLFMKDPFDFQLRYLLPRTVGVFEPFKDVPSFSSWQGLPQRLTFLLNDRAFGKFIHAMGEAARWQKVFNEASLETTRQALAKVSPCSAAAWPSSPSTSSPITCAAPAASSWTCTGSRRNSTKPWSSSCRSC